ncbi:Hypothetical protein IALB_0038 [Ignavibacterium album JCM 16511]|uniref:Uracil-DNA glycosylase-like domain-containing protein n=1 Tax=Ignavibacterium album (strain DSM 19864 / JCM 16511 / NBRC 101810 / Mat9-16) TaxID=945713 RepID=I0AFJ5_IGNAJ|nr:SMUG2 DNA glycosylase family protein [Ignavibacterium album]AFH47752.1 Hypothetical protein IALB_0038 [Ignavibacterium album JCM 16511]
MSFADKAIKYFSGLKTPELNFNQTELLNPYSSSEVKKILKEFYLKYYNDDKERIFIIGINPGRFGGGLTGISFTDPVSLREECRINNNLGNQKELSSKFIYSVAKEFGGVKKFFSRVFLTALYPFALLKNGKNYNYYDDKNLSEHLKPEIVKNIKSQIQFGAKRDFAILLGKKNAAYFEILNYEHNFFRKIIVVEHPRYIMQYRLKQSDVYINKYLEVINN